MEWAPPQQVATRQLALPESGKLVKFGHCGSGRTVALQRMNKNVKILGKVVKGS